jgi:hypothetical protein
LSKNTKDKGIADFWLFLSAACVIDAQAALKI